jgi:hypothetical protein
LEHFKKLLPFKVVAASDQQDPDSCRLALRLICRLQESREENDLKQRGNKTAPRTNYRPLHGENYTKTASAWHDKRRGWRQVQCRAIL